MDLKYSFNTRVKSVETIKGLNGYGYATQGMLKSWDSLGFNWAVNDDSADVAIAFDMPHHVRWTKGQYKILYTPWESTELLPGWADIMNECDEIWTPSPLIAEWYVKHAGVKVPVYVYEHGIDHAWKPVKRVPSERIKFLHIGAEATRKGGWDTVRAFRRAFPGRDDVSLTLKMINQDWNGIPELGRVKYLNNTLNFAQMKLLYYTHDAYVYPSYGEGFGLTPFQALATGMPTITLPGWAPYRRFIDPKLEISHKLVRSNWPKIHPGQVMRPNFDEVIDRMRYVADNYDDARDFACSNAFDLHAAYDWDIITAQVFSDLKKRLK